jgi:hypothetical protein
MTGKSRSGPAPAHRVTGPRRLIVGSGFGAPQVVIVAAMYALVVDAISALYLGDVLGPSGVGLVTTAVAGSLWQVRLRAPLAQIRGGATVPGIIAGLASIVDLLYFAPTVLDGLIHLLLFLLLYRLYTRETLRDVRDIGFICFFMLVAAAPVTIVPESVGCLPLSDGAESSPLATAPAKSLKNSVSVVPSSSR